MKSRSRRPRRARDRSGTATPGRGSQRLAERDGGKRLAWMGSEVAGNGTEKLLSKFGELSLADTGNAGELLAGGRIGPRHPAERHIRKDHVGGNVAGIGELF